MEMKSSHPGWTTCLMLLLLAASHARGAHRDEKIYRAVLASRDSALDLLEKVVNIDSGTNDVAGGEKVEALVTARLQAIGADVRRIPSEAPGLPDCVLATLHGSGKARILMIAHVDTVFSPGTVATRPFRIEGNRAHGPGVGDEKAGLVNAVTALTILHDQKFDKFASISLLLDNSEERGSPGSTELIKSLARANDVELNMEPGDPPDSITVWRKGSSTLRVHVTGRAAHAGVAPQDGRNAATELVHQLSVLETAFPHSGSGTTVNLTVIKAGDRRNIIPDSAEALFSVRYRRRADFDAVLAKFNELTAGTVVPDTLVKVDSDGSSFPPLVENPAIDALADRAHRIYAELGKTLENSGNGGASESALAMSEGTPALDGLGFVGGEFHTDHEWIDLDSVTPRLYLLTRLLMDVSRSMVARGAPVL